MNRSTENKILTCGAVEMGRVMFQLLHLIIVLVVMKKSTYVQASYEAIVSLQKSAHQIIERFPTQQKF
ncbi:hypothetical protein H6784_01500 [Candidatus Nomurabacteria bacterium]|nr:hypothetical protein [Candidatus Kaiserbacteria bacterium]MCB9814069.1 hypothetical protein [Candidatus Nomurabacteria bacterium]